MATTLIPYACKSADNIPLIGGDDCELGNLEGFLAIYKSEKAKIATLSSAVLLDLTKRGKLLVFTFSSAESANKEKTFEDKGWERTTTDTGYVRFKMNFKFGACKDNELCKLDQNKNWLLIPIFSKGALLFANDKVGDITGYSGKFIQESHWMPRMSGSDTSGNSITFDFDQVSTNLWCSSKVAFSMDDVDVSQIEGPRGLGISFVTPPVAGTEVKVKLTEKCTGDSVIGLEDLTPTEIAQLLNAVVNGTGVDITTAVVDPSDNSIYTLTLATALAVTNQVYIETNEGSYEIVEIGGGTYRGKTETETVA